MQPIQITIRDIPPTVALENCIRKKAEKLNHYYHRINSCRVVVEVPQKHKRQGKLFSVHIDLTVPGKELVVNKHYDQDVYVAVRDAFRALKRQLEQYADKRRGEVKCHELLNAGYISKLMREDGYGFIQGMDGNEYYFSSANVANTEFAHLELGDMVHFLSEAGDDGWQAHRVRKN